MAENKNTGVLFEQLVRCIYRDLKQFTDSDNFIVCHERVFTTSEFSDAFLRVPHCQKANKQQNNLNYKKLSGDKGFGEKDFYVPLKNASTRLEYYSSLKNKMGEIRNIYQEISNDHHKIFRNLYENMKELYYSSPYKSFAVPLNEVPDENNHYLPCIYEMLENSLDAYLSGKDIGKVFRTTKLMPRNFVERTEEEKDLETRLNQDSIVIISGEPGIGKTELAVHYAYNHKKDYEIILFVPFKESIKSSIMAVTEKSVDDFQYEWKFILNLLKSYGKRMLIIIDGANGKEIDSVFSLLKRTGCDVIITTRYRYDHAIELERMGLETWEGFIISQLSEKADENSTDYKMAAELICQQSANLSMLIALFVRAIKQSGINIIDIAKRPELFTELTFQRPVLFEKYNGKKSKTTIYDHLINLYQIETLPDNIEHILKFFCLFNTLYFPSEILAKLCPSCTNECVKELEKYHLIYKANGYDETYYMFQYTLKNIRNTIDINCHEEFSGEISSISKWISNTTSFDNTIASWLYPLVFNLKSTSSEWKKCRYEILGYLNMSDNKYFFSTAKNHILNDEIGQPRPDETETDKLTDEYDRLYLSASELKQYQSFIKEHFDIKVQRDTSLIKALLREAESDILHEPEAAITRVGIILILIMNYVYPGRISFNKSKCQNVTEVEIVERLNQELKASSIHETQLSKSIRKYVNTSEAEENLPDIFNDTYLYRHTIFYILHIYWSCIFYQGIATERNMNYLNMIRKHYAKHIKTYSDLSDHSYIQHYHLANMLNYTLRFEEAKSIIEFEENVARQKGISNIDYLLHYIILGADVAVSIYMRKSFQRLSVITPSPDDRRIYNIIRNSSRFFYRKLYYTALRYGTESHYRISCYFSPKTLSNQIKSVIYKMYLGRLITCDTYKKSIDFSEKACNDIRYRHKTDSEHCTFNLPT